MPLARRRRITELLTSGQQFDVAFGQRAMLDEREHLGGERRVVLHQLGDVRPDGRELGVGYPLSLRREEGVAVAPEHVHRRLVPDSQVRGHVRHEARLIWVYVRVFCGCSAERLRSSVPIVERASVPQFPSSPGLLRVRRRGRRELGNWVQTPNSCFSGFSRDVRASVLAK